MFAGHLRAVRGAGGSSLNCLNSTLVLAPFLAALLVALTRLVDYRHDVYDITAGSLLGLGTAWLVYRRFFMPLSGMRCGWAYQPRRVEDVRTGVRRQDDEENQFGADRDGVGDEDFSLQDFTDDENEENRNEIGEERRPLNDDNHLFGETETGIRKATGIQGSILLEKLKIHYIGNAMIAVRFASLNTAHTRRLFTLTPF